jgi:HPt (histidine-containing phosphotransfer) domain-containing protein
VDPDIGSAIAQLVPAYLRRRAAEIQTLKDALRVDDLEAIQHIAHNWKGTGSGYGFCQITEIGRRMEAAAKSGGRAEIRACLAELSEFLATLKA